MLLAAALAVGVEAQNFPSQAIRLIAPFPPGGSVDITARLIAEPLGGELGTRVVVDNRSGASGNIGMVATSPHVLVVHPRVPAGRLEDLVRLARARPGKLSYASAGVGTTFHLCGEMFKDSTGTFILHVPYRGGGPALLDTLAGQVDLSFPTLSAALPHVKAGTLRALAVTGITRSSQLPEVPTLQEAGVKDFQFTQWLALLAPAGTSPAVVARLNSALRNALNSKELREKFQAQAFEPFSTTPEDAGKFIASEAQRLAKLIKTRGITAN